MAPFDWDGRSENAAVLLAQANMTRAEIAEKVGVDRRTIGRWQDHPDFRARIDELVAEIASEVRRIGIATVVGRVRVQNHRHRLMMRVIEARADDESFAVAPGGTTGLLVRKLKSIGSGENTTIVQEFEVDTGLLRELRELEKQVAIELGQWQAEKFDPGKLDIQVAVGLTNEAAAGYRDPPETDE